MSERLTERDLEEIRERAKKVTEGPWKSEEVNEWYGTYSIWREKDDRYAYPLARELSKGNAEFIAHAREDIPKLLAEIDRLRAGNEYCKRIVSGLTRENAILKGEKPITVKLNGGDSE